MKYKVEDKLMLALKSKLRKAYADAQRIDDCQAKSFEEAITTIAQETYDYIKSKEAEGK